MTRNPDVRILSIENGADWVPFLFKQFKNVYSKMPQGFLEDPLEAFRRLVTRTVATSRPLALAWGALATGPDALLEPLRSRA